MVKIQIYNIHVHNDVTKYTIIVPNFYYLDRTLTNLL